MAKNNRTPREKAEDRRQSAVLEKLEAAHLAGFMHERIPPAAPEPTKHTWRTPARTPGSKSALYINPGRFGLVVIEIPKHEDPRTALKTLGIANERLIDTTFVEYELLQLWLAGGTPVLAERHECPAGWISQDAWVPSPHPEDLNQLLTAAKSATPTDVCASWIQKPRQSIGDLAWERLKAAIAADEEAEAAQLANDVQLWACRRVRDAARAMVTTTDATERIARRRAAHLWQGADRRQR